MKKTARFISALLLSLTLGVVLSIAGGLVVATLLAFSRLESIWPMLGSCKAPAFFGLLIGAPVGCVTGVAIAGKILLPLSRTWLGVLAGLVVYAAAMLALLSSAPASSSLPQYVVLLFPSVLATAAFYCCCKRKRLPENGEARRGLTQN
jgi:hypothetical protein